MKIVFSFHARQRMLQRGINEATIIEIIQNPDLVLSSFEGRKIAVKRIEKTWKVVFKEEENEIFVISVFFN